jgi:hypothetical protein
VTSQKKKATSLEEKALNEQAKNWQLIMVIWQQVMPI